MSKLKISARAEGRNERHALIGVFQNGGKAGVLTVDAEHEAAVVGLLNAATELLEACEACEYISRSTLSVKGTRSQPWFGRMLAAIEKAKGK